MFIRRRLLRHRRRIPVEIIKAALAAKSPPMAADLTQDDLARPKSLRDEAVWGCGGWRVRRRDLDCADALLAAAGATSTGGRGWCSGRRMRANRHAVAKDEHYKLLPAASSALALVEGDIGTARTMTPTDQPPPVRGHRRRRRARPGAEGQVTTGYRRSGAKRRWVTAGASTVLGCSGFCCLVGEGDRPAS